MKELEMISKNYKKFIFPILFFSFSSISYAKTYHYSVTLYSKKCYLNMEKSPSISAQKGDTLIFHMDDPSVRNRDFTVSEKENNMENYKGVRKDKRKKTVTVTIKDENPEVLYYSCSRYQSSGSTILIGK